MKMVRCDYCRKKFDCTKEECPHCGTKRIVYNEGDSRLVWFQAHRYSSQKAPFTRFLARVIDVLLLVLFTEFFFGPLLSRYMGGTMALQILVPIGTLLQLLFEPLCMTLWGYTPGKRILNIAVRNREGEKKSFAEYFRRSFMALFWGFGFLLPVVSLFTLYFSYVRVSHGEPTRWDEDENTIVLQKKFNLVVGILAVVVILLECFLFFNLSHEIFSFHDSMIRK